MPIRQPSSTVQLWRMAPCPTLSLIHISFDPVALDVACADAVNRQPVLPGTQLEEMSHSHTGDHFHVNHPDTNWRSCVEHAEKLGLGTQSYELITVK